MCIRDRTADVLVVLIATKWNVNLLHNLPPRFCLSVLIATKWNVNSSWHSKGRTCDIVLIATKWNVNYNLGGDFHTFSRINSYKMECKQQPFFRLSLHPPSINSYKMECKHPCNNVKIISKKRINSYKMEYTVCHQS